MVSAFPDEFKPFLNTTGHGLLVATGEQSPPTEAPPTSGCVPRATTQVRGNTWVHLFGAPSWAEAHAAVQAFRGQGLAATLAPADESHLPSWETRNRPVWVNPDAAICFPWVSCDAPLVVEIDPGAAFGTGSHPTTLLLLRWLAEAQPDGLRVLDVGCGSGVLGLFAAALGSAEVVGIDLRADAVAAANANARRNGLSQVASFELGSLSLSAAHGPDAHRHETAANKSPVIKPPVDSDGVEEISEPLTDGFDVVLANLDAATLRQLAPELVAAARAGGIIAVSGISKAQASVVSAALRSHGAYLPSGRPTNPPQSPSPTAPTADLSHPRPGVWVLDDYCALAVVRST